MQDCIDRQHMQADLRLPWVIVAVAVLILIAILAVCRLMGAEIQQPLPEDTREWVRTVLYGVAIVTLPLTNLLRHVQMRLNHTMPLEQKSYRQVAKSRYLLTIIISTALIQSPGLYGFVMFILGDQFNTVIIFSLMSALGWYLYRPKLDEYEHLVISLANQDDE